jgi:hypothetical protein
MVGQVQYQLWQKSGIRRKILDLLVIGLVDLLGLDGSGPKEGQHKCQEFIGSHVFFAFGTVHQNTHFPVNGSGPLV